MMLRPLLLLALMAGALCNAVEPTPIPESGMPVIMNSGCFTDLEGVVTCNDLSAARVQECEVDMVFVADESGSIGSNNYQRVKAGTLTIVKSSLWSGDYSTATGSHFGYVSFDAQAVEQFGLDAFQALTPAGYEQAINNLPYDGGLTDISKGLLKAQQVFAAHTHQGAAADKVAVLITDGVSDEASAAAAAAALKADGVFLLVIGITSGVNTSFLQSIADKYIAVVDFNQFETGVATYLQSQLCTIIEEPNLNE